MGQVSGHVVRTWARISFVLLAVWVSDAPAATFTVTTTADSGAGSLHQAITDANLAAGPHLIDVTVSGTITQTIALPPVSESVTIRIPPLSTLTVTGSGLSIDLGKSVTVDALGAMTISDVSGAGSLVKTGSDKLTLGGTSTYTGGTTVSGGTLQGDTNTLKGNITNDASVIFNQTAAGDYTGVISGTGTLTKQGSESLTLSGANTYTGVTDVAAGTLIVNGSAASAVSVQAGANLAGAGTVGSTTVSGTIAPGNTIGTLTVNDNFTQNAGSTYEVEMNSLGTVPGVNNDLINVIGTPGNATINGGTVDVQADPGTYNPGTSYTILTTAGTVSGTGYTSITDNLTLRDFVLVYNANSVELMVQRTAGNYAANAITSNQFSVGTSLDAINAMAVGDMGVVLDELLGLTPAQQAAAMGQMSGEVHGTMASLGLQNTSHLIGLLSRQLASVQRPQMRITQAIDSYPASNDSPIQLVSHTTSANRPAPRQTCCRYRGWDGWVLGYGLGGNAEEDGNAAAAEYSTGGTLFGMQRWLNMQTMIGVYGGYGHSQADSTTPDQSAQVDSAKVGGYLRYLDDRGYWLATGGFGYDDYDSARRVTFGGIDRVATADYSGQQAIAYLERGIVKCCRDYRVTPLAALQYIYLHQNDFTESGAGALNLSVDDTHTHSLRSLVGIDITRPCGTIWRHRVDPRFRAAWMHEFLDTSGLAQASFASAGSPAFDVRGLDLGRDWAVVGYGVDLRNRQHAALFLGYDVQFNSNQTFHVGSVGLRANW